MQIYSDTVTAGEDILASQYNNLRTDSFYLMTFSMYGLSAWNDFTSDNYNVYSVTGNSSVYRYYIWPKTLAYNSGSSSNSYWFNPADYDNFISITMIGDYLYVWAQQTADSNWYVIRIHKTTETVTEMVFDGTDDPDNDAQNWLSTDDTYLYIHDQNGTTVRKYSISGTDLTHESNITLDQAPFALYYCDGTYFYGRINGGKNVIKYDMTGTTVDNKYIDSGGIRCIGPIHGLLHFVIAVAPGNYAIKPLAF